MVIFSVWLSVVGTVPSGLCSATGLSVLNVTMSVLGMGSDVACAPSCLSTVSTAQLPPQQSNCNSYQDTAVCGLLAATNVGALNASVTCTTDGVPSMDPCLWSGVGCNNGVLTSLSIQEVGMEGMTSIPCAS